MYFAKQMVMFLYIPVFVWCSKSKQNAWLFLSFVSMKAVGSDFFFVWKC